MEVELLAGSERVQLLKNGRSRVTKKDLMEKYGRGKKVIVQQTRRNPQILAHYRDDKRERIHAPLTHLDLAGETDTPPPDWEALLGAVTSVAPGNNGATTYHRAIQA